MANKRNFKAITTDDLAFNPHTAWSLFHKTTEEWQEELMNKNDGKDLVEIIDRDMVSDYYLVKRGTWNRLEPLIAAIEHHDDEERLTLECGKMFFKLLVQEMDKQ